MSDKPTAAERMGEVWSKNKPLTLTVAALGSLVLGAFWLGFKVNGYLSDQKVALSEIQASQAEQAERYKTLAGEIATIKQHEDRVKAMEGRLDALETAIKALKALADLHIGLRWDVMMMEEWSRQLQKALSDAGTALQLPDVRTIRARTLVDDR